MDQQSLLYIFVFLIGTSILNFAIAITARIHTRHKEFNKLILYWPSLILTFIAAGALNGSSTQIGFAYFFQFFPTFLGSKILDSSQGSKLNWTKYLSIQAGCLLLSTYLLTQTDLGFTISLLPTSFGFSLVLGVLAWNTLVVTKKTSNWIEKSLAVMFITGIINHFNYPFFRLIPEAGYWGWSVALAQYQCLSLFLPLLISYNREENERSKLNQAIKKISGQHSVSKTTIDELYKNLEHQIAQKDELYRELKRSNTNLEDEREINEILIRTISHDLSNPLTVISAYSEMLNNGKTSSDEAPKLMERIRINTLTAINMITRIRNAILTRTQADLVKTGPVDLNVALDKLSMSFESRLNEKRISLDLTGLADKDFFIEAEESALIDHVLSNIISNAIKYSYPDSKINIHVSENASDMIDVEITDYGHGIKKSRLSKKTLHSTLGTNGEQGTGFGLMVLGYFIRSFGASFSIDSRTEGPDRGTTVMLSFKKSSPEYLIPLTQNIAADSYTASLNS